MSADMATVRLGVLAYPDCFASEIFGILDLLAMGAQVARASDPHAKTAFATTVMSPRRRVIASSGVGVAAKPVSEVDVLVVPGFELVPGASLADRLDKLGPEVAAIAAHVRAGRPVVSVCVGAFLLGAAGVLDGRRVTTSWLFAERLAEAFPACEVTADALVVTDDGVTTTAAFTAMFDLTLDLLRHHHGPLVAQRTASIALVDASRSSQAPYVDPDLLGPSTPGFAGEVQRWLDHNLRAPYDLPALASRFNVSTRTMLRRYKAQTGDTPLQYLQSSRMRRARRLLESDARTMGQIITDVGYRDSGAFGRLFVRHVGISPGEYRAKFAERPAVARRDS